MILLASRNETRSTLWHESETARLVFLVGQIVLGSFDLFTLTDYRPRGQLWQRIVSESAGVKAA